MENRNQNINEKAKRFTLSLPDNVHEELKEVASEQGISLRDVVIKSLKIGMIAFETEKDPDKDLIIREKLPTGETKETNIIFV